MRTAAWGNLLLRDMHLALQSVQDPQDLRGGEGKAMIALWRNGIISFVYLVQSAKPCCEIHAKRRCGYPQEEMADLSGKTTYTPSYPRYPQVFGDVDKQKLWKLKERMFCEVVLNCHFFWRKWRKVLDASEWRKKVTVQPCTIPRAKSLCIRFCELCKRQSAKLIPKEFTFLDAFCVHCGYMATTMLRKKWNISHELLQHRLQICYNDYTIIQWKGWVIWNLLLLERILK